QRTGGPVTRRSPPTCRGGGGTSRPPSGTPGDRRRPRASARPARAAARWRIGELRGQEDHGREERRGGQVGDAEALADQVARGVQLGLETVERPEHLLAAARRACIVDLHVSPHHDPEGGEEGAVEATSARPEAEREGGGR